MRSYAGLPKRKKQQDIKLKYLTRSGIENFVDGDLSDDYTMQVVGSFVDTLRDRIDKVRTQDTEVKHSQKKRNKRRNVQYMLTLICRSFLNEGCSIK